MHWLILYEEKRGMKSWWCFIRIFIIYAVTFSWLFLLSIENHLSLYRSRAWLFLLLVQVWTLGSDREHTNIYKCFKMNHVLKCLIPLYCRGWRNNVVGNFVKMINILDYRWKMCFILLIALWVIGWTFTFKKLKIGRVLSRNLSKKKKVRVLSRILIAANLE